jgi:valyl-tRNA synthetase
MLDARRDFVNKLWNIGRFVMSVTTSEQRRRALAPAIARANAPLAERWIASRLAAVTAEVTRLLGEYNFGEAARIIHDFIWDEVADWYVEAYKILAREDQADGALLAQVYEKALRILHPYAPFATEELWQRLTTGTADRPIALMITPWPEPASARDLAAEAAWSDVMAVTRAARTLRSEYHIAPSTIVPASIVPATPELVAFWRSNAELLGALPEMWLKPIDVLDAADGAPAELASRSVATVAGGAELLIPAEGLFDAGRELGRTNEELAEAQKHVRRLEGQLASDFGKRAPAEVVERERERLEEQRERERTLERRRATLARLSGTPEK